MKNSIAFNKVFHTLLFSTFFVPVGDPSVWVPEKFDNVIPNSYSFSEKGLGISVNNSASPLFYAFEKPRKINKVRIKAELKDNPPKLNNNVTQGFRGNDDFVLRFGLVTKGGGRLNWLQRQFAPSWLVRLENRIPKNTGVEGVSFYTTCQQEKLLHKPRKHFLNSKMIETCIKLINEPGFFEIEVSPKEMNEIIGLWLASDGDDTHSKFQVLIDEIAISYK